MIRHLELSQDNICYVGDIHGHYSDLMRRLDSVRFDPSKDILVSSGDIIDRGPESFECLSLIAQPWFVPVIGNHELLAIISSLNGFDGAAHARWIANGGDWYERTDSFTRNKIAELINVLIKSIKPCLEIAIKETGHKVGVVHSGIPKGTSWQNVREQTLSNDELHRLITTRVKHIYDLETEFDTAPAELDMLVVGHNCLSHTPFSSGKMVFSDTGASKGGGVVLSRHGDLLDLVQKDRSEFKMVF